MVFFKISRFINSRELLIFYVVYMKKYLFIILIIIGLFSISSAYAQDFQGIDEDFNYSDQLQSIGDVEIDKAQLNLAEPTSSEGSFSDLDNLIQDNNTNELILDKNYTYNNYSDSKFNTTGGYIKINKSISIDGQGHYIDAVNSSVLFYIEGNQNEVIISNLNFLNVCNSGFYTWGGVFCLNKTTLILNNCNFINTSSTLNGEGSCIFSKNSNIFINNCSFVNSQSGYGAALDITKSNLTINDSKFLANEAQYTPVITGEFFGSFNNCYFKDNYGGNNGIMSLSKSSIVNFTNCKFINNSASHYANGPSIGIVCGEILFSGCDISCNDSLLSYNYANLTIDSCNFFNSNREIEGGDSFLSSVPGVADSVLKIYNSNFTNLHYANGLICSNNNAIVDNCRFVNCSSRFTAIIKSTESRSSLIVNNSVFDSNVVNLTGSILVVNNANIVNSVFINNRVGNSIISVKSGSPVYLINNTIKNNDVNSISNEGIIKSLNLKVMNSKGAVGRPVLLNASVKDGDNHIINNGNVEFYIGGEYVGVSKLVNGFATLNYTPNLSGNYTISAIYKGTDSSTISHNGTLELGFPFLLLNVETSTNELIYGNYFNIQISVNNPHNVGKNNIKVLESLSSNFIYLNSTTNSGTYNPKTGIWDINTLAGGATAKLSIRFRLNSSGIFNNTIKLISGNDSVSSNIVVNVNHIASNLTISCGNESDIHVKLTANNKGVFNKTIILNVGNENYTAVTDINGEAKVIIYNSPGKYDVSAIFKEDYSHSSSSASSTINISKFATLLTLSNITVIYGESASIEVILSSNGKGIVNKSIVFGFIGEYYNLTTDDEGKANILVKKDIGVYGFAALFVGDDIYLGSNASAILEVSKIPINIISVSSISTTYNSGKYIKINVLDKNNVPVGNIKINIKIYNGSKLYKTMVLNTDGNGIIKYDCSKLPVGVYKMEISLNNNIYSANSLKSTITLKKAPTLVSAPKVTYKYNTKNYFRITVKNKSTKKAVSNLKLKIKVFTGKKYKYYSVKTNSKGLAKFNTKYLNRGIHAVLITSSNSYYSLSYKSSIKIR